MKISIFILLTAFAIAGSSASTTHTPSKDKKITLSDLDINNDNKISLKEYIKHLEKKKYARKEKAIARTFKLCDKNSDGAVSLNELADINKSKSIKSIKKRECEIPKEVVKALDTNNDGVLTKEEALKSVSNPSRETERKLNESIKKKRYEKENIYAKNHFKDCDKDKDSLLTLREATSRACSMDSDSFDEQDADKDEMLNFKEYSNKKISEINRAKKMLKTKYFTESKGAERLQIALKACDLDSDGFLSINEATDQDCGVDKDIFKIFDSNSDDYIGAQESKSIYYYRAFNRYDKNKDGFIDSSEFKKIPKYIL